MANQTGIAIVIKAFLPTGKTLDEQFNALTIVKNAHSTGDYAELLKAATVEEVKTEQKTRRIEDAAPAAADTSTDEADPDEQPDTANDAGTEHDATAGEQAGVGDADAAQESSRRTRSRAA